MQKTKSLTLVILTVLIVTGGLFLFANRNEQVTYTSTNEELRMLQTFLKEQGLYRATVNGKLTSATIISLRRFQKNNTLSQTGILDSATVAKIREISQGKVSLTVITPRSTPSTESGAVLNDEQDG